MCDLPKHGEATFLRHAARPSQKAGRSLHEGGCDGIGVGRSSSVPRPAGSVHRSGGVVLDCEAVARIPDGQDRV